MNRICLLLAILYHLPLLATQGVLAADVLHESDTSAAAQLPLTHTSEDDEILKGAGSDYPIFQHNAVLWPASFDPLEEFRHALDVMQTTWFEVWVGTWPTAIDWTRAVLDTYLISSLSTSGRVADGHLQHRSRHFDLNDIYNDINKYFAQNVAYYFGEDALSLRNQAYDDMLWVVLGWLESAKFIKERCESHASHNLSTLQSNRGQKWHGHQFISTYAHQAHVFYELASRGWDTQFCGGGMIWNPYLAPYKNAITNELFISASVGMYLYFPGDNNTSPFVASDPHMSDLEPTGPFNPEFLQAAVDGYAWLKNSNMTNHKGLYVDGFHIFGWKLNGTQCNVKDHMVYTYNQAVVLSGLRGLWEATGNSTYLEDGHELARNAITATGWNLRTASAANMDEWTGLGRNGILEDHCDASGGCDQNAQTFKGIFFHHLTLFCKPLPLQPIVPGKTFSADKTLALLHRWSCREYAIWTAHNAAAALATRDQKGRFGMWWGAKDGVESPTLPEGVIDRYNHGYRLSTSPWARKIRARWSHAVQSYGEGHVLDKHGRIRRPQPEATFSAVNDNPTTSSDLNDRGRGRTVETQGGGVAVLRALIELMNLG